MNFWHCCVTYEGDHHVTTHLTSAGATRVAIFDIMDFLGLEDSEPRRAQRSWSTSGSDEAVELETDHKVISEMNDDQLNQLFRQFAEETWDNDIGYSIEICTSRLQA